MNAPLKLVGLARPPAAEPEPMLTPAQQEALDAVVAMTRCSNVVALAGDAGMGKSTVLRALATELGGELVGIAQMLEIVRPHDEKYWDLPLFDFLMSRLRASRILIVDDLSSFTQTMESGRIYFLRYLLRELLYRCAEDEGLTLIVGGPVPVGEGTVQEMFRRTDMPIVEISRFGPADYREVASNVMGRDAAEGIDFNQVFRFASLLNSHELRMATSIAAMHDKPSTSDVLDAIAEFVVSSNTRTREVEDISFATMPGMEFIADQLETHVVLPLTNIELAEQLNLKPKRGVLLHGRPGTGKTSVGRALAHRLKGRFFLIDGSVRTEPAYAFLSKVQAIAKEAMENAPSVLFIDDADVLFDIGHVAGLTRYLLTLLDGLAGESASKVCVMMTAMDPARIPEAILRSGRVELWLETHLPDADVRSGILRRWMSDALPQAGEIDYPQLGEATEGFTPADLRRVVADSKAFFAADLTSGRAPASGTDYVLKSIDALLATRVAMATNLSDPSLRIR